MQQETRREIVDRYLRFSGEVNDADAREIANDLVASAVQSMWLRHPFTEFVMPVDYTFSTAVGQPFYVLPTYYGRIASKEGIVRNQTTGAKIFPIRQGDLEQLYPAIGGTLDTARADPAHYTISGKVGVSVQVAIAGEALEAVSSNNGDADIHLQIEGLDANGEWNTTQVTLTGTVAVALGTWKYVQTVGKGYTVTADPATPLTSSRGTITIRKVIGAATRLVLLPHEASREQYQLRLYPTPAAVQTIAVPIIRLPRRIFQDADPLPAMWGNAVFEEMKIQGAVNARELAEGAAEQLPRPEFLSLIGYDNELKPATRRRKQAFGS